MAVLKDILRYSPYIGQLLRYPLRKLLYKHIHYTTNISSGCRIRPRYVWLGAHVYIGRNDRIEGVPYYNGRTYTPLIILHDRVSIQQNSHLTCAEKIEIGANTAIAANVTITDINHPYEDITKPIERQPLDVKPVTIGEDCKIYNNCVILPGVNIGKHCCIGANSVVTHDVPDYSVAVGSPARVIKRYSFEEKKWIRIKK